MDNKDFDRLIRQTLEEFEPPVVKSEVENTLDKVLKGNRGSGHWSGWKGSLYSALTVAILAGSVWMTSKFLLPADQPMYETVMTDSGNPVYPEDMEMDENHAITGTEATATAEQIMVEEQAPGEQILAEEQVFAETSNPEKELPAEQIMVEEQAPGEQIVVEKQAFAEQVSPEEQAPAEQIMVEEQAPGEQIVAEKQAFAETSNPEKELPAEQIMVEEQAPGEQILAEEQAFAETSNPEKELPAEQITVEEQAPGEQIVAEKQAFAEKVSPEEQAPVEQIMVEEQALPEQNILETNGLVVQTILEKQSQPRQLSETVSAEVPVVLPTPEVALENNTVEIPATSAERGVPGDSAQDGNDKIRSRKGIDNGEPQKSTDISSMEPVPAVSNTNWSLGAIVEVDQGSFSYGLNAQVRFRNGIGVETGVDIRKYATQFYQDRLHYDQAGHHCANRHIEHHFDEHEQIRDIRIKNTLVQMPVKVSYALSAGRGWYALGMVGTVIDIHLNEQMTYVVHTDTVPESNQTYTTSGTVNLLNSLQLGLGAEKRWSRFSIQLMTNFSQQFKTVYYKQRLSDFGASFSVNYRLGKAKP